jgi:hypothetical protein
MHPSAIVRGVVLTNARDGASLAKLYGRLGAEAAEFTSLDGWKLLPLRAVGNWVDAALEARPGNSSPTMTLFLKDFVAWAQTLDSPGRQAV